MTNIVMLLGGIYFATLAGAHEATIYSIIPAILCFVAFGLGIQSKWLLSRPWRTATAAFVIILLVVQLAADFAVANASDYYAMASILINGALLILFLGVLLSTLKGSVTQERKERDEEQVRRPLSRQTAQK